VQIYTYYNALGDHSTFLTHYTLQWYIWLVSAEVNAWIYQLFFMVCS